jgi:hypothetical protein
VRAIRGVPEFVPEDRTAHGEEKAAVAAAFARAKEQEERRAHDAEPVDPLAVRESAEGVTVGSIRVSEGRGAHLLDYRQMEVLAEWCREHGRPNLLANARRQREAHRAAAERQKREYEQKLARRRERDRAREAVREVERVEAERDRLELDLGKLVAEGADETRLRLAEGALAGAERRVVRARAAAGWLRKWAS